MKIDNVFHSKILEIFLSLTDNANIRKERGDNENLFKQIKIEIPTVNDLERIITSLPM